MKPDGAKPSANALPLPDVRGKRFAIVSARFYDDLADWMVDGATRALNDCGVAAEDIFLYQVPGCFELPLACRNIVDTERFDAVVALGVVIQGETPHFDFVAGECARGIMDVQLATGVPIGFGVLTTNNYDQAAERADPKRGNKGYLAGIAAATLITVPSDLPRAGFR